MNQHKAAFNHLMQKLSIVYDKAITTVLLDAYYDALEHYPIAELNQAVTSYMRQTDKDCRFMPKPGDLIAMIAGRNDEAAMTAWLKVNKAMKSIGHWQSIAFDDPIIHRVLSDLGGWIWLAQRQETEMRFVEKRFCEAYQYYRRQQTPFDYPVYLAGSSEIANVLNGYKAAEPQKFGNPKRVEAVMNKTFDLSKEKERPARSRQALEEHLSEEAQYA